MYKISSTIWRFIIMREDDLQFLEKLNSTPALRKRFEEILNIAQNTSGELITADEAEGKAIEEIQKLGQEILQEWAVKQHEKAVHMIKQENPKSRKHEKKNSIGNQHLEE
jgi:hypothetical protein